MKKSCYICKHAVTVKYKRRGPKLFYDDKPPLQNKRITFCIAGPPPNTCYKNTLTLEGITYGAARFRQYMRYPPVGVNAPCSLYEKSEANEKKFIADQKRKAEEDQKQKKKKESVKLKKKQKEEEKKRKEAEAKKKKMQLEKRRKYQREYAKRKRQEKMAQEEAIKKQKNSFDRFEIMEVEV